MTQVILKKGRERSVIQRHPWIFSGAVQKSDRLRPGQPVDVISAGGRLLGRGFGSPDSNIVVRVVTFGEEPLTDNVLRARLDDALTWRTAHPRLKSRDAMRVVNAEGDGIPGFIADRFGDTLVFQSLFAGLEPKKSLLVGHLVEKLGPARVVERSDDDSRDHEGLPKVAGLWRGEAPEGPVFFEESGLTIGADVMAGHKTGYYLDQCYNRSRIVDYAPGRTVLNAFSYVGTFGHLAASAGATSVVQLDGSADALALSQKIAAANQLSGIEHEQGDAFARLREYQTEKRRFELIVLDPPKFAAGKGHLEKAARGYKDINRLALQLLEPGGVLFTFSCSGAMDPAFFQKVLFQASVEAGRDVEILEHLNQDVDHPFRLGFPQGEYLKGLVLRVTRTQTNQREVSGP